jgi:hypothetical protein
MKICRKCNLKKSHKCFEKNRCVCKSCKSIYDHLRYKEKNPNARRIPKLNGVPDGQLIEALKKKTSIAAAAKSIGLKADSGGLYVRCRRLISEYKIDTSHFLGQGWNKGRKFAPKRSIEDYFNGTPITSHKLRLRLIKEGLKEHKCEECNHTHWMNHPIALELHHINGQRNDNSFSNLKILCPNCHAQTDNYRSKNKI